MFCSLEKLKIGMSASLLFGLFLTAHGEWLRGRLNSKYLVSKGKNLHWRECGKNICGKDAINCHFAYSKSKECYQINLPLQLLLKWFREKILIKDENMKIYYGDTDRGNIMTEKPRVWWLYDNVNRGRNFGTAGSALDIPVGSVVWKKNARGPRAGSPLLYARGNNVEKVALMHNGTLLLDMVANFTISMWIKMDNYIYIHSALLVGVPSIATRFLFWPGVDMSDLALAFNDGGKYHYTQKVYAGRNGWRHVAVAYNSGSSPIFFLNGDVWPLQNDPGDVKERIRPTHLVMWNSASPSVYSKYRGLIACVMVFQAALSQSQIKILKDNCP